MGAFQTHRLNPLMETCLLRTFTGPRHSHNSTAGLSTGDGRKEGKKERESVCVSTKVEIIYSFTVRPENPDKAG